MCHCAGHSLQSSVCSLLSCCRGGAEPATSLDGSRPGAHGNQVTPGPAGNQLGGHSAVRQRDGKRRRMTREEEDLLVPPSSHCTPSWMRSPHPASTPPCSRESRGLYLHPTDSHHHCHSLRSSPTRTTWRIQQQHIHWLTEDVCTFGCDYELFIDQWVDPNLSSSWWFTVELVVSYYSMSVNINFPLESGLSCTTLFSFFQLRFDCWQLDCFIFYYCSF